MAAMTLEWSDDALADLDRFALFLQDKHRSLAQRIASEIITKSQVLADHPKPGRPILAVRNIGKSSCRSSTHNMCFNTDMTAIGWSCFAFSMAEKVAIERAASAIRG